MDDRQERFRGAMLGTLIGDAFGLPFEGTPRAALTELARQVRRRAARPFAWGYSDDTEMMIGVAEELIERRRIEPDALLARLRDNFDPGRGYGKALKLVLDSAGDARPRWDSRGCGAAVRVAPIATVYHQHPFLLARDVATSALITHTHPEAVTAALVQGLALGEVLRLDSPPELAIAPFIESLLTTIRATAPAPLSGELEEKLRWIAATAHTPLTPADVVTRLGHSPLAVDAVPAALCAFVHAPRCGYEALCFAVSLGGDTDSIGALTGALVGALLGTAGFPAGWLAALEQGPRGAGYVTTLADRLWLRHAAGVYDRR